jgi:hypothetical protein
MKTSEQIDKLALALCKAQGAIDNIEKNRKAHGYQYADLGQCLTAIRLPFFENGLCIVQAPIDKENLGKAIITRIIHSSGQWIESEFSFGLVELKNKDGKAVLNPLQQLGAAITYARRYGLSSMVGLSQEDDDAASLRKQQEQEVKVSQDNLRSNLSKTLASKCEENDIDTKSFASHFSIDAKDVENLKKALSNFDTLLAEYKNTKTLANALMEKCKENNICTKSFVTHFNIKSSEIESLKKGLTNIDTLLAEYKNLEYEEEVSNVA